MSLGNVGRNNTYLPKETTPVQGAQQTPATKKTEPVQTGAGKAEGAQPTKDVANISNAQVATALTAVSLFGPIAPAVTATSVAAVVLYNAVDILPGEERLQKAAEEMAKAAVEIMKKYMSQPPEVK